MPKNQIFSSEDAKDTLITVDISDQKSYSPEFYEFVNQQQVKISNDEKKLGQLEEALRIGAWTDPIFNDPHISELALSLFAANKITKQQLDTILERVQTFKDYKHIKTVSILDEHGQFTREAQTILFPSLFGGIAYNNLTNKQLKNFKLLIEKLPKSEQIFYTTAGGDQLANLPFIRSFLDFQAILIDPTNNKNLVHLSKGVEDALNQVRFGKDCVTRVSTLGDKTYIG